MQYTVIKVGDLKQAGPNWLKLKAWIAGSDGKPAEGPGTEVFIWNKSADAAGKYTAGSVWDGEIKVRISKDPQYPDENTFSGKLVSVGTAPAAPTAGADTPRGYASDDKEGRIVRENSVNVASGFFAGSKADVNDFWALARQVVIYDMSGKIVKMSTKLQHEAILAMFMKHEGEKVAPDVEAAEQAVFDFAGTISIRALTFSEAAAFLESMNPPTPD